MSSRITQQWATFGRLWYILNAERQSPGRIANVVCPILQGMHKPIYYHAVDCGDHVVIYNTRHIALEGETWIRKLYHHHTGSIMPLTNNEKQKRFVEKSKSTGQYEEYKQKKAAAMKRCREKRNEQESTLPKHVRNQLESKRREATRQRVAKHRELKKEESAKPVGMGPFRSAMAYAKATARARRMMHQVLPTTPRRRLAVSRKLYEMEIKQGPELPSTSRERKKTGPPQLSRKLLN
ncbi:39S ribosomal protein L13, mitochondrial [Holothuria leucospilota]|uniref:39S ribosomal protein L13, mitochondrial n=1 Tax=Holothuria leucospilota TaxID=206669 RepID=A0A9Q1H4N8_HOLLE|nr:39S ribosomal protein L13, mitochondrial [Holothuria leucospilota]